ncbi:MAG: radical SAM protein [Bacteroidales bacterium]|nr:radical SAM protein [Bacteroidales bacterium]
MLCKAPFCNLYFDYKGNVYCCFANKIKIGDYLNNSIQEIWNSEKLKEIRESIITKSLNFGCFFCKQKIQDGDLFSVYARRYSNLIYNKQYFFPTSFELQLFNYCNSNCIMCVVSKDESINVNIQKVKEILNQYLPYLKEISFSGGEPFYINEYYELWNFLHSANPNIKVSVNTNASIYNEKVQNILSKLKFNITISLDSINKSTYEKIRKGLKFEIVMNNFFKFKNYTEENNTHFNVKSCILRDNIYELPEIFKYFNDLKVNIFLNEVFYPFEHSVLLLKYEKIKEIYRYLVLNNPFKNNGEHIYNFIRWKEMLRTLKKILSLNEFIIVNKNRIPLLYKAVINRYKECFFLKRYEFAKKLNDITNQLNKTELLLFYKALLLLPVERLFLELEVRENDFLLFLLRNIEKVEI